MAGDWLDLEACFCALDGVRRSSCGGPVALADALAASCVAKLRCVGAPAEVRAEAKAAVWGIPALTAKFQLVAMSSTRAHASDARQTWLAWADKVLADKHGSEACRFLRPSPTLATPRGHEVVSGGDASVLVTEAEAIARPLVKVWSNPLDVREPIPAHDLMAARLVASTVPVLSVAAIKHASKSFPGRTAVAGGWHPTHFACLSDPAVGALGEVLRCSLIAGDMPLMLRRLRAPVLSRPIGEAGCGLPVGEPRTIGIFSSAWRQHGKLLRPSVARWEKGLDAQAGFFLNALGKSLSASVWRQAVRGHGAALDGGLWPRSRLTWRRPSTTSTAAICGPRRSKPSTR